MKKSTKLLSVLLAIIMIFSCMSVMASAYETYTDGREALYDSNDKGSAVLMTDEQRMSFICDTVNKLLASAGLRMDVPVIGTIDLTSIDALFDTMDTIEGLVTGTKWLINLGDIESMNLSAFADKKNMSIYDANGATACINQVITFLDNNASWLAGIIEKGSLDLGLIENFVDISFVNEILADIPGMIKGLVYGLGQRQITNGIGDDPAYPNEAEYKALETKPDLDSILVGMLKGLLSEPRHTTKITDPSQNLICTDPTTYGASAEMIHTEPADDGSGDTWYYIYGTQDANGKWTFTKDSAKEDESDKQYITHWNPSSILAPTLDTTVFDKLHDGTSIYTLVGSLLPWAYNIYGAPNLDGQLRATIMQFCGAVNRAETNETITAQLKEKVLAYQAIEDNDNGGANGRASLSDAMEAKVGEAGNYNFQYISLSGANINTMPDDLYYVVQWGNGWEFYHVDFSQMKGEKLELFKMLNWEWQAPTWSEIMPTLDPTADSYLRNITDAIGKILDKAVLNLEWTYDSASEDNAHFEANVMGLVRKVLKAAPELIYGKNDAYKAEAIDTQTDEQVIAVLGADIMEWLMPALVLPEDVSCLEELVVYGVREFIAEILPEYNWDAQIAAASTDEDYLNIALSMGTSIGAYYLKEIMGLGTQTNGSGTTTKVTVPMGPDYTWEQTLDFIVDNILEQWVPGLTKTIRTENATVFAADDPLNKLSIVFNTLFPGLLSLMSGCSATIGDGTNKDCVVDLKVVKNLIAGILNLEIEPIAAKLYRNNSGIATTTVYQAVVTLLKDLTAGLGFDASNDYTSLTACLDTALAQANPLDYLISKASIKALLSNLIWVITDPGTTPLWMQDALRIVIQATGSMDDMSYSGLSATPDSASYYGNGTVTVKPSIMLTTSGVPSVFYANGYREGTRTVDGIYSGVLNKLEITDLAGNVLVSAADLNTALTLNSAYKYETGLAFTVTANVNAYILKAYVTVTTPYNTSFAVTSQSVFKAASVAQGDEAVSLTHDTGDRLTMTYNNIYIDENTPLSAASGYELSVYNGYTNILGYAGSGFTLSGYGKNTQDAKTGAVTLSGYTAGRVSWEISTNGGAATTKEPSSTSADSVPFYWHWDDVYNGSVNNDANRIKSEESLATNMWLVDTSAGKSRDQYKADFTTFKFSGSNYKLYYFNGIRHNWISTGSSFATPYIVLYNSYDLQRLIDTELNNLKNPADYTTESFQAYADALNAAIAQYYNPRSAATFVSDNYVGGVSKFATAANNLKTATANLVALTDSSASGFTGEEQAAFAALKADLDGYAAKNYNNKNFIMYRWLKYYNEYAYLNNLYNSTVAPSGVAANDLAGVPSDNDVISAVIAAAPADKQGALNAMVVAPTEEEQAAAAQALVDFNNNLPKIDLAALAIDREQIAQYESRLIADNAYTYYLADAYNMVKGISDPSAYTAESWAKFNKARTAAYNVAAEATSTPAQIHEARYDLLVAYKGLIAAGKDVDLTNLRDVMAYVDTICANPTLFQPTAASGYKTLDEALAAVFAEAGVKVTVDDDTYYIGGGDTGAAWLDEAGMRTKLEAQETVDRVVREIEAALKNIESAIKVIPDETVSGNTTAVDYANLIVDGIKPGTINTENELLALVKTSAPDGYTANLAVTPSAANGFGTGTKVVLTVNGVDGFEIKHTVMVYGDVNGDGAIDAFDAALINMNKYGVATLTGDFATAGDTNADGSVDLDDYAMVWSYAVGEGAIAQTRP